MRAIGSHRTRATRGVWRVAGATVALAGAVALTACGNAAQPDQGASAVQVVAQPEDRGQVIINAITTAKQSVDIPIYSLGGEQMLDALREAKSNGVNIRIMLNGGYGNSESQARKVAQAMAAAPGAGRVAVHWSSENFDVTHQKSVIVDAASSAGAPLPPAQLPDSAKVIISTGNFSEFRKTPFWAARDYDAVVTDPQVVAEVAEVFANDFNCPARDVIDPVRPPGDARLVWSNGTTGFIEPETYPARYPLDQRDWPTDVTVQGNARAAYLQVISAAGAGDVLRFMSEELLDARVIAALTRAATPVSSGGQGADVRILMSLPKGYTESRSQAYRSQLGGVWRVVAAGGTAHMFINNVDVPAALYIHGKMIMRNAEQGVVGSQNAGFMSFNANRELGLNVSAADQQAVSTLVRTFDADWSRDDSWVRVWTAKNVPTVPPLSLFKQLPPAVTTDAGEAPVERRQRCGPVQLQ